MTLHQTATHVPTLNMIILITYITEGSECQIGDLVPIHLRHPLITDGVIALPRLYPQNRVGIT